MSGDKPRWLRLPNHRARGAAVSYAEVSSSANSEAFLESGSGEGFADLDRKRLAKARSLLFFLAGSAWGVLKNLWLSDLRRAM